MVWSEGETTKKDRTRTATSLLHSSSLCPQTCSSQLPTGEQRNLRWADDGFVDTRISGDRYTAFLVAGALMIPYPNQ